MEGTEKSVTLLKNLEKLVLRLVLIARNFKIDLSVEKLTFKKMQDQEILKLYTPLCKKHI